jgi:hypothetical protein
MDIPALAKQHGVTPNEWRTRFLVLRAALWKSDFRRFAREVVRIRTKDAQIEPLLLNSAQDLLLGEAEKMLKDEGWVRLIGLKGRQQGFSTMVAARGYWRATLWDHQHIYILSHEMDSTNKLFAMVELMQKHNDFAPEVGTDNAKQLEFKKRGSSYFVATAGPKAGGRGGNTSFFHGSEVSRWTNPDEHFAASVDAVPETRGVWGVLYRRPENPLPFELKHPEVIEGWVQAPSEIWLETTSAGPTGRFHKDYRDAMAGKSDYRHVFVPWNVQTEYTRDGEFDPGEDPEEEGGVSELEYQRSFRLTDGQMLWRRARIQKLGSLGKFRQEYPLSIDEAFSTGDHPDSFIKGRDILLARTREMEDPDAPLILGVDPASAGGDRFAIAWRRGDKCLKIRYRHKLSHEAAVAWITSVIDEYRPSRVNIDRGNIGANIITTVRSMSPDYALLVRGIDFGSTSQAKEANPKRSGPVNRRAEIYGRMRDWLKEASIPDEHDLSEDLAAPRIKYRPNNDWLLESKSDMKARGVRSPDLGDALALTFASQEYFAEWSKPDKTVGFSVGAPQRMETKTRSAPSSAYGWMG